MQPFPYADDYEAPEDEEPFELGPESQPPMTVPQRMLAMEKRQMVQGKELKAVHTKVDKLLKMMAWKQRAKQVAYTAGPALLTALAAQFPQAKHLLLSLIDFLQVTQ